MAEEERLFGDIPSFLEAKFREKWGDQWQSKWDRWEAKMGRHWGCGGRTDFGARSWSARSSGNLAFDEWRETELARLEEERQKLLAAEREFAAYMENLRRAKDREEFDRFMAARRNGGDTNPPQPWRNLSTTGGAICAAGCLLFNRWARRAGAWFRRV